MVYRDGKDKLLTHAVICILEINETFYNSTQSDTKANERMFILERMWKMWNLSFFKIWNKIPQRKHS